MSLMQIDEKPKPKVEDKDIRVTERAAAHIGRLLEREEKAGSALRIRVIGGGCTGLQYSLSFDKEKKETDLEWNSNGVRVLLDPASHEYIAGSTVDFEDDLNGSGFKIDNPNAASTCGCGESFGI